MTTLTIRRNRIGPVVARHPWIFAGALESVPEGLETGAAVRVVAPDGRFLAQGYFNGYSQIAVRVWSWEESEAVDDAFFRRRIERALILRERIVTGTRTNAYRLVFGENDLIPGLVVDRYADHLCLQCHTRGIDVWRDAIVRALVEVVKPAGIYERSDVKVRGIEGAESTTGLLFGDVPPLVEILENGLKFFVDLAGGQKTGFFLDQRDKRDALRRYVRDRRMLNCFCYTGGFSVYAGAAGAAHVTSVDVSARALELAEKNVLANDLARDRFDFVCADVKAFLANHEHTTIASAATEAAFDVIILDPPAFVKDRRKVKEGLAGYRRINEAAVRLLPSGGILLTCSCSGHVSMADFRHLIAECAGRAGKTVQILETHGHGPDHPELAPYTESAYLKTLICSVW
ncbi:MAG: class I SAM-dependent rRNA methyltransferase [Opitutaceae bacterium]